MVLSSYTQLQTLLIFYNGTGPNKIRADNLPEEVIIRSEKKIKWKTWGPRVPTNLRILVSSTWRDK